MSVVVGVVCSLGAFALALERGVAGIAKRRVEKLLTEAADALGFTQGEASWNPTDRQAEAFSRVGTHDGCAASLELLPTWTGRARLALTVTPSTPNDVTFSRPRVVAGLQDTFFGPSPPFTGDPAFDAQISVVPETPVGRAACDARVRELCLAGVASGKVTFEAGKARSVMRGRIAVSDVVSRLDEMAELCRRVETHLADVPQSLATQALEDPLPDVRLESFIALVAHYPGAEPTASAAKRLLDTAHPARLRVEAATFWAQRMWPSEETEDDCRVEAADLVIDVLFGLLGPDPEQRPGPHLCARALKAAAKLVSEWNALPASVRDGAHVFGSLPKAEDYSASPKIVQARYISAIHLLSYRSPERFLEASGSVDGRSLPEGLALGILESLERLGTDRAEPALLQLLHHPNSDVCVRAADLLGELGTDRVEPTLLQLLRHRELDVCVRAAELLGEVGTTMSVDRLTACNGGPQRLSVAAGQAVARIHERHGLAGHGALSFGEASSGDLSLARAGQLSQSDDPPDTH